jgi:hypothetical protein
MQALDWNFCLPLRFGNSNTPLLELRRAVTQDPSRERFETFIQERFRKAHKAQISQFMPELFGLQDSEGSLQAVAGVRLAISEPLFLERYLDEPIEQTLESTAARTVDRLGIVEVGNLAAANLGSARLSIITVTWLLAMAGLEWVAFTGNSALVNSFNRLGLRPVTLCPADPLRLGEERHAWGNYYETRPHVHVGDIRSGFLHLRQSGVFEHFGLPPSLERSCHVA